MRLTDSSAGAAEGRRRFRKVLGKAGVVDYEALAVIDYEPVRCRLWLRIGYLVGVYAGFLGSALAIGVLTTNRYAGAYAGIPIGAVCGWILGMTAYHWAAARELARQVGSEGTEVPPIGWLALTADEISFWKVRRWNPWALESTPALVVAPEGWQIEAPEHVVSGAPHEVAIIDSLGHRIRMRASGISDSELASRILDGLNGNPKGEPDGFSGR